METGGLKQEKRHAPLKRRFEPLSPVNNTLYCLKICIETYVRKQKVLELCSKIKSKVVKLQLGAEVFTGAVFEITKEM